MNENINNNWLDKTIDFLFEKKELVYLIIIIGIGAILRAIVANNVYPLADEMVHGPQSIGFLDTGKIGHMIESVSWRYMNDIVFNIAGFTMFSSRFLSFFFGTLTIIIVYLLGKLIYNKKVGLIAASLLSISVFTIRYTLIEMDETMMFFVLFGIYLFIKKLKEENKISILSGIILGLSIPIKTIGSFFIVAIFIYMLFYLKLNKNFREFVEKNKTNILLFSIIILFFTSSILIYNHLLFKDKGIVDVYFAGYFNINREMYSWVSGYDHSFTPSEILPGIYNMFKGNFFQYDFIITSLALIGIILCLFFKFKEERKWSYLLLFCIFIPMGILAGTNLLSTHYVSFMTIFVIFAAVTLDFLAEKLKNLIEPKKFIIISLTLVAIINIILLLPYLTSTTALNGLRDYSINSIDENSIVIADGRIYRGQIVFAFFDKHYIESSLLNQAVAQTVNSKEPMMPIKAYYIECAADDCGWGTIKDQPDFNKSMEEMTEFFKNISILKKEILAGGNDNLASGRKNADNGSPYFKVYETTLNLKSSIVKIIDSTHSWWMYPVNYKPKEAIFDNYTTKSWEDNLLNFIGHISIFLAVILSILTPFYLIYILFKDLNTR